jgi:hypothetical protein
MNGIELEKPEYVTALETRLANLQRMFNGLLLAGADMGVSKSVFSGQMDSFKDELFALRNQYLQTAAERISALVESGQNHGDPYPKLPLGSIIRKKADGSVDLKEASEYGWPTSELGKKTVLMAIEKEIADSKPLDAEKSEPEP